MTEIRGEGPQKDIDEIMRLHNIWVKANRTGSIPMMRDAFVGGDRVLRMEPQRLFVRRNRRVGDAVGVARQVQSESDARRGRRPARASPRRNRMALVQRAVHYHARRRPAAAGQRQVPQHRGVRARGRTRQAGLEDVALPFFVVRAGPANGSRTRLKTMAKVRRVRSRFRKSAHARVRRARQARRGTGHRNVLDSRGFHSTAAHSRWRRQSRAVRRRSRLASAS